jgi:DNA-binding response OmpR family regulator
MMPSSPISIVLVEDDAGLSLAMERVLQAAGFQTWAFPSAESLLSYRAASHAACFVLDVHLPGMNGFELCKVLNGMTQVPVIFITAHDEPETRSEAEANSSAILVKPFSGRVLIQAVHEALLPHSQN